MRLALREFVLFWCYAWGIGGAAYAMFLLGCASWR